MGQRKYNGEMIVFNEWCWDNRTTKRKKMNLETDLTPFPKINSKWTVDLNIKCKSIKPAGV